MSKEDKKEIKLFIEQFNIEKEINQVKILFLLYFAIASFIIFFEAFELRIIWYLNKEALLEKSLLVLVCTMYLILANMVIGIPIKSILSLTPYGFGSKDYRSKKIAADKDNKEIEKDQLRENAITLISFVIGLIVSFTLLIHLSFFKASNQNIRDESIGKAIVSCLFVSSEDKAQCQAFEKKIEIIKSNNITLIYYSSEFTIWTYEKNSTEYKLLIPTKFLQRLEAEEDMGENDNEKNA